MPSDDQHREQAILEAALIGMLDRFEEAARTSLPVREMPLFEERSPSVTDWAKGTAIDWDGGTPSMWYPLEDSDECFNALKYLCELPDADLIAKRAGKREDNYEAMRWTLRALLRTALDSANPRADGVAKALELFEVKGRSERVDLRAFTLLSGVKVDEPLELADSIRLLPSTTDAIRKHIVPAIFMLSDREIPRVLGDGALLEIQVATEVEAARPRAKGAALKTAKRALQALRLSVEDSVAAWQPTVTGLTPLDRSPSWGDITRAPTSLAHRGESLVSAPADFAKLFEKLDEEHLLSELRIALDRLQGPLDYGSRDPILDYWIGLEALTIPGKAPEIRYRAGLHLAYVLGSTVEERKTILKAARSSYDVRSSVIHGSRPSEEKLLDGTANARDLLRRTTAAFLLGDLSGDSIEDLILGG